MLNIQPLVRKFLPQDLQINSWQDLQPYAKDLANRNIASLEDYQRFLEDHSEFDAIVNEDQAKRYNAKSCNTADKNLEDAYNMFVQEIDPELAEYDDVFNKKIVQSPFASQVNIPGFSLALKNFQNQIDIYRPENIPLETAIEETNMESAKLRGARRIKLDGQELTPQRAATRLFLTDRHERETAWLAIAMNAVADVPVLDKIYSEQVEKRHQIALNAGFENYRDYKFVQLNRVDYTPKDCLNFSSAIRETVTPIVTKVRQERARKLGLEQLRPWDLAVNPDHAPPLKVFKDADDLIAKTKLVFGSLHSDFADTITLMQEKNRLDLASRLNKSPGGFMNPMLESKIPFVFANVTETVRDMVTLIHEGGHAVHEIEASNLPLTMFRSYPTEVAEFASKSMELMTMDHWHIFFDNKEDCMRAQREHLESILGSFTMVARIDEFQQEIYTHPEYSADKRHDVWNKLQDDLDGGVVDWSGFEERRRTSWQDTPHIFELPFYYIEYAISQIAALQIWRNYKQDPQNAVSQYKAALQLGGTKSIAEIYATAGIKFDFSKEMLGELMDFVQGELAGLSLSSAHETQYPKPV